MSVNFQNYSKYYNLLYGDKDYTSEVDYVVNTISQYSTGAKDILEYGSGTGVHGMLFQNKGYQVYGLEQSEGMVTEARLKGLACQVADISNYSLDKQFDVVISLFHVISYLTSNEDLTNAFKNAYRHLRKDGLFVFDVWYSPAVYEQKPSVKVKHMADKELKVTRIAEPRIHYNKNVVDVNFTIIAKDLKTGQVEEFGECHPMRHFSIPEIGLLASLCNFEVIKTEEFLTGNEPSSNTWGVCFVLKKKV